MSVRGALVVAAIVASSPVAHAEPSAEPVPLRLPMGSRVRVQTAVAPGAWTRGILTSADSASISMIPERAVPLGANQLSLPSASVTRFELVTGTKRYWLRGLLVGAAVGTIIGATADVDPVTCDSYYSYSFCSRGEAYAAGVISMGLLGTGIGALVKTDRWTPVALDALGPPPPRVSGVHPRLSARPRGGLELALAVGF